jgi:hypothetical protein
MQALESRVKSTNASTTVTVADSNASPPVQASAMQNFAIPTPTWSDSSLDQEVTAGNSSTSIGGSVTQSLDFDAFFNMDAFSGMIQLSPLLALALY